MADTVSSHLSRKPKARGTTVEWLMKRDEMTAKLRAELSRKSKPEFAIVRLMKSVGEAFRSALKQP
jgi:hypothetical protein